MSIDWEDMLSGKFVKLENGVEKKLEVSNWRPQEQFKDDKTGEAKKGVIFDIKKEDNKEYPDEPHEWTVTAMKAIAKLKPILEKAEQESRASVFLSVVRAGEGKSTVYEIREVEAF